ncbi:MAG: MotA/TolQ/ExbB proton channel family protein [Chryseobacterium sp.]|nr:MAG: MotA/TolQ/ExbB proton channel family protein [Chryseobacterium sp.]
MEMNVSNHEHVDAAKTKKGGLNPAIVIPILLLIGIAIYLFLFGHPSNFRKADAIAGQASVAFADIDTKELHPESFMGIIYMGGPVVPVLITFMIIVIVFSIERGFVLSRASGKGNLDNFVNTVRAYLTRNEINAALEECDRQQGSVGNVVKEGLTTYKALEHDNTMNKEQKLIALNKSLEEATTLEMPMLEKNMMILSTLGTVATLVALLGTVIGMIKAFFALGSGGGTPDAAALSIGISEALINTALGIGTSAVAIIFYNYFTSKIDGLTYKIDEIGMSIQQSFAEHN